MSDDPISEAQLRKEAGQARTLLESEYFVTFTRELELAAMEFAITAPTPEAREEARIEVHLVRKMRGYLQIMRDSITDLETARKQMAAHE